MEPPAVVPEVAVAPSPDEMGRHSMHLAQLLWRRRWQESTACCSLRRTSRFPVVEALVAAVRAVRIPTERPEAVGRLVAAVAVVAAPSPAGPVASAAGAALAS